MRQLYMSCSENFMLYYSVMLIPLCGTCIFIAA